MNFFQITIDNTVGYNHDAVHKIITVNSNVSAWWHYLPNVYIIKTASTAKFHADRLISNFQGLPFLLTKLDLSDYNGFLQKNAWDWINSHSNTKSTYRPLPQIKPLIPPLPRYSMPPTLQEILDRANKIHR